MQNLIELSEKEDVKDICVLSNSEIDMKTVLIKEYEKRKKKIELQ